MILYLYYICQPNNYMSRLDHDKISSIIAHVAIEVEKITASPLDIHKLFKILYFADANYLIDCGYSITDDTYIKMSNGPVPSKIYDIIKVLRENVVSFDIMESYKKLFKISNHKYIKVLNTPDYDEIPVKELEFINNSIVENALLNFERLTEKSHGISWQNASNAKPINEFDIIKEFGGTSENIQYIQTLRTI